MVMNNNGVSLGTGTLKHETDAAILVELDDSGEEIWIPKSQVHDDSEVYSIDTEEGPDQGEDGKVVVSEWWAGKNGLV
jgi:hypothetical protein